MHAKKHNRQQNRVFNEVDHNAPPELVIMLCGAYLGKGRVSADLFIRDLLAGNLGKGRGHTASTLRLFAAKIRDQEHSSPLGRSADPAFRGIRTQVKTPVRETFS